MRPIARLVLLLAPSLLALSLPAHPSTAAHGGADGAASVAGMLLVAEEQLGDPNFSHTVLLMVHHDAEGAMGLVINRRYGQAPMAELLRQLGRQPGKAGGVVELYYGGPVEPDVGFLLHGPGYATQASRRVTALLSMTSDPQAIADLAEGQVPGPSKLLLGYAGWGAGQLESEMARKDWLAVPAEAGLVFNDQPEQIWQSAIARRGTDL
jgi:putative transcriptional regulator